MPATTEAEKVRVRVPVRPEQAPSVNERPAKQPPHAVILHNDNINGFGHVIRTLQKVFGFGKAKAIKLTLEAHTKGRSCVWSGTKELAELKAEQVQSCGPDPLMVEKGAQPLRVSVEPQPG